MKHYGKNVSAYQNLLQEEDLLSDYWSARLSTMADSTKAHRIHIHQATKTAAQSNSQSKISESVDSKITSEASNALQNAISSDDMADSALRLDTGIWSSHAQLELADLVWSNTNSEYVNIVSSLTRMLADPATVKYYDADSLQQIAAVFNKKYIPALPEDSDDTSRMSIASAVSSRDLSVVTEASPLTILSQAQIDLRPALHALNGYALSAAPDEAQVMGELGGIDQHYSDWSSALMATDGAETSLTKWIKPKAELA